MQRTNSSTSHQPKATTVEFWQPSIHTIERLEKRIEGHHEALVRLATQPTSATTAHAFLSNQEAVRELETALRAEMGRLNILSQLEEFAALAAQGLEAFKAGFRDLRAMRDSTSNCLGDATYLYYGLYKQAQHQGVSVKHVPTPHQLEHDLLPMRVVDVSMACPNCGEALVYQSSYIDKADIDGHIDILLACSSGVDCLSYEQERTLGIRIKVG